MATLTVEKNILARCPGCKGSLSTYEYMHAGKTLGALDGNHLLGPFQYRLYRCAGCGQGGLGKIIVKDAGSFAASAVGLAEFYPETSERLQLPADTPPGLVAEFREAEACIAARCSRAAAGMFRSVLDKTLRANGYKVKPGTTLEQQIDAAVEDGVITKARSIKAHADIRVLGNDVLHDAWRPIDPDTVELAHHYAQRILEDFYGDRATVEGQLLARNRVLEPIAPVVVEGASNEATGREVSKAPRPLTPLRG